MMLFRPVKENELSALYELAETAGQGLTSLPKDESLLAMQLQRSCQSFAKDVSYPYNEYYLFGLEDTTTKKLVGTAAIEASKGYNAPFFVFHHLKKNATSLALTIHRSTDYLLASTTYHHASELCTLFLHRQYRGHGNGLLLSLARFLFVAEHPQRFAKLMIADMRGVFDEQGVSPFWQYIAQHFFPLSHEQVIEKLLSTDKLFISDLMPLEPISLIALPQTIREIIGKPHAHTVPAMNILIKEGFYYNHFVDIFDGGPIIEAQRDSIHTVATNKLVPIEKLVDEVKEGHRYMIATPLLPMKAVLTQAFYQPHAHTCTIDKKTAEALNVSVNDSVRIIAV